MYYTGFLPDYYQTYSNLSGMLYNYLKSLLPNQIESVATPEHNQYDIDIENNCILVCK